MPFTHEETEVVTGLKDMWHNGAKKLLMILIGISCVILILIAGVCIGIFALDSRVNGLNTRVGVVEGEQSLAQNQAEIRKKVEENTAAIKEYEEAVNEGWQKFQDHNPTVPIPQISNADSSGKADVVVIPPRIKPTPLPKEKTKTRTVIKYKTKPTPKPWWSR